MQNGSGSGPATQPETAHPQDSNATPEGQIHDDENARPLLSLVSESPGHAPPVEDGFFAKGAADDKAAMEMYAAMLPRGYNLGRINPRYLIVAGAAVLLFIGIVAGRHLPGGSNRPVATATPDEASPSVAPAPVVAVPAPTAPAAPAPAPAAAPTPPAPTAQTDEAAAVVPTPSPVAKEIAAPTPAVAPTPTEQATAQPEKPVVPAPAVAAPSAEPKAAEVAAAPAAEPAAVAEAQDAQICRDALKKRDMRAVSASCEKAIAADASLAKPLLAFAKAQFEKGKSAQAAVWARKIIQVNGSLADAYLIMGAAEQEAHHAAAAKTAYQRYLELAPKGPYAEDVRSSLKSL